VTPNIDARRIGHLELKIIRRARALEIEAQLKSLGHRKCHLSPQGHKSTTFVKIVLQFQAPTLAATHPTLRMTRRKDLPGFNVFKQRIDDFLGSHRDSKQAKSSTPGRQHRLQEALNERISKNTIRLVFLKKVHFPTAVMAVLTRSTADGN
jgi:hypothetical protein